MSLSKQRHNKNSMHEFDAFAADPLMYLVDTMFSGDRGVRLSNKLGAWTGDMKIDSTETKDAFLISADLPGVDKNDIKISLNDQILTVEAERKDTTENVEGNKRWRERTFGRIRRSMTLPKDINPEDYTCKFENGVLNIRLSKREPKSESNYLNIE